MRKTFVKAVCIFLTLCAALFVLSSCDFTDLIYPKETPDLKPHLIDQSRAETDPIRPIDAKEAAEVTGETFRDRVDSLYTAVISGKKPVFAENDEASEVYEAAVAVLNRYVLNDFTPFERVHAIHDYLTYCVTYDFELYERYLSGDSQIDSDDPSFNIDGVLLSGSAVCDGISKAFVFMCAIEGIRSVQILGTAASADSSGIIRSTPHAWNKVELGGKWYNLDATLDRANYYLDGKLKSQIHHGYFLVSDKSIKNPAFGKHTFANDPEYNKEDYDANEDYPLFGEMSVSVGGKSYPALIKTQSELNALFTAVKNAGRKIGKIEIKLDFDGVTADRAESYESELKEAYRLIPDKDFVLDASKKVYPYIRYSGGVCLLLIYK